MVRYKRRHHRAQPDNLYAEIQQGLATHTAFASYQLSTRERANRLRRTQKRRQGLWLPLWHCKSRYIAPYPIYAGNPLIVPRSRSLKRCLREAKGENERYRECFWTRWRIVSCARLCPVAAALSEDNASYGPALYCIYHFVGKPKALCRARSPLLPPLASVDARKFSILREV